MGYAFTIVIRESYFSQVAAYKIRNPLVTAVIIGDYSNTLSPSITSANKDYQNIIESFYGCYGYTVVVAQNCKNNGDYTLEYFQTDNEVKSCNFKSKWTSDEIEDFNERINTHIIGSENAPFDSLIYIVSCHGDGKNLIYDSNGEDFSLSFIYHQFNNKNCRILRSKPKVYLLDTYKNSDITADTHGNNVKKEKVDVAEIVVTKNQHSTVLEQAVAPTYTEKSHCRKIFGNSGHLPRILNDKTDWISKEMQNGSIFIQCFRQVLKNRSKSSNDNLTDILNKTRKHMAMKLHLPQNNDNAIVLNDDSTMPYEIEFESKTNQHESKNDEYVNHIPQQTVCKLNVYKCVF